MSDGGQRTVAQGRQGSGDGLDHDDQEEKLLSRPFAWLKSLLELVKERSQVCGSISINGKV